MEASEKKSSVTLLIVAWLVVGVPAAWGVWQTFNTSLDLFRAKPVAAAIPGPAPLTMPATRP